MHLYHSATSGARRQQGRQISWKRDDSRSRLVALVTVLRRPTQETRPPLSRCGMLLTGCYEQSAYAGEPRYNKGSTQYVCSYMHSQLIVDRAAERGLLGGFGDVWRDSGDVRPVLPVERGCVLDALIGQLRRVLRSSHVC